MCVQTAPAVTPVRGLISTPQRQLSWSLIAEPATSPAWSEPADTSGIDRMKLAEILSDMALMMQDVAEMIATNQLR